MTSCGDRASCLQDASMLPYLNSMSCKHLQCMVLAKSGQPGNDLAFTGIEGSPAFDMEVGREIAAVNHVRRRGA